MKWYRAVRRTLLSSSVSHHRRTRFHSHVPPLPSSFSLSLNSSMNDRSYHAHAHRAACQCGIVFRGPRAVEQKEMHRATEHGVPSDRTVLDGGPPSALL